MSAAAKPDLVGRGESIDPELALARWENEGGRTRAASPRDRTGRSRLLTGQGNRSGVRVERVYVDREQRDDIRVLVDRLWPRGLSRARADLNDWCKGVAPSAELRSWYGHDPDRFAEFERRYRRELDDPERADALRYLRELARCQTLTLLTATRNLEISAAAVLADVLNAEKQTRR